MPSKPWPSIRAEVMRITKEDICGAPVVGPATTIVTDGFVSISPSPQYEEGTETVEKNANGKIAWVDKPKDELKYISTSIAFNLVNPDVFNMIMGSPIVLDGDGNAVGIRLGETVKTSFGLEGWSDVPGVPCVGAVPYGYFLWPWLQGGRLADFSLQNEKASFTIENCLTQAGAPWAKGPYNVVINGTGGTAAPGKLLTAIGPKEHLHMQQTLVPPPAVTAGPVALAA
ncbi:hypothetical protein GCM10007304_17640 [Rhodococcoides trifolii]|uniref:Uncharacterized protein n=1 Tax=Rhodococcoides trifolii TaxID=908250 RepID=A0A917D008_9NOCA|nr:hypothetical protein [Rhodococcus trifolii]GGG03972.1 hypothetical protein GCM10007304_17640 [Rhodococcus trifolii]